MRLFSVDKNGSFAEYSEETFGKHHDEEALESWLESNPGAILDDEELLVMGRQLSTDLGRFLDLLALDRDGNTVVVEFKRGRTPRDTLAQALEYAAFCGSLDYDQLEGVLHEYTGEEGHTLSETHRAFFGLAEDEGASFNKEQRVILVAQEITPDVRATARYLRQRQLPVSCVEFGYFQSASGEEVLARETVVGKEPLGGSPVRPVPLPRTDRCKFRASVDEHAWPVFEAVLALTDDPNLIHWGQRGFSLNVDVGGTHVALCFGYPPSSVFRQSLYTAFADIRRKVRDGSKLADEFAERFADTEAFVSAQREMKWLLEGSISEAQIETVTDLLTDLGCSVQEHGLAE